MDILKEDIIKNKVSKLDFRLPIETQKSAIDFLAYVEDKYLYLLFNKDLKYTWQNSVYVIRKIGFPRNKLLLPNLIWLLQDINWPGALISIDVLADIEKEELVPLIETAITKAYEIKDYMWLGGLKMLIDKTSIQANDFCDSEVFCLLKYADF